VQDWSPNGDYLSLDLEKNDLIYKIWILPLIGKREPFLSAASSTAAADADNTTDIFSGWPLAVVFLLRVRASEVYVVRFQSNA